MHFADYIKRLHVRGRVLSFQRAKRNVNENTVLIGIEGLKTRKDCDFYLGKRLAYVYKVKKQQDGARRRTIWGRVTRPHGNSGVVRAKFTKNLPPVSFGKPVRVMLYPSRI